MPVITLHTHISAPIAVVFNLSRSIDLHTLSTAHTNEKAVAGCTGGLIRMGESVTWQARHLGIRQKLTSKITAFNAPFYFTDEMVQGAFKRFKHQHIFKEEAGQVAMTDIFDYQSPLGILGRFADAIFLKNYMTALLTERNRIIKEYAEDEGKWGLVPGIVHV